MKVSGKRQKKDRARARVIKARVVEPYYLGAGYTPAEYGCESR